MRIVLAFSEKMRESASMYPLVSFRVVVFFR